MSSFLDAHNISKESLLNKSNITSIRETVFSNGLAVELYTFATDHNLVVKHYYYDWIAAITKTPITEINQEAVLAKVHRVLKQAKGKRGQAKQDYLSQTFLIPSQTASSECSTASTSATQHLPVQSLVTPPPSKLISTLHKKGEVLVETREKAKQYKRKLERLGTKVEEKKLKLDFAEKEKKQLEKELNVKEREIKDTKYRLGRQTVLNAKNRLSMIELKNQVVELKRENKQNETQIHSLIKAIDDNDETVTWALQQEQELADTKVAVDYLQAQVDDRPELKLYDETSNKYTNDTVMCVMNLTDMKVPVERVGPVIKEVAKMCGKTVDRVPSGATVNRLVDSKIALSQKQIGTVLKDKEATTLYTDETRKYGKCMQTYLLTDKDQNSYILGLREMVDKSGQSTLDTLKDILSDITTYCHETDNDRSIGYTILSNIRDTMSDRASTEKHFNKLLEEFRSQILPQVIDNWEEMSEDEQKLFSKMNNFYCGLHLLVGFADTCESTLKKFENNFLDGKEIGSAKKVELKRYHKNESGALRLMRTSSKCFAVGQDEKNGVSLSWGTYLKSKNEKNKIVRFKHNRFNLVFSLASAVYFHRQKISEFLDTVHGTSNDLLKAVTLDIKEDLLLAGLKAFGLVSKLVTGPLWSLLETPGHILEMNVYYKQLVDFLTRGADDIGLIDQFIRGEASPFDTVVRQDDETRVLLEDNDTLNGILVPMLQALFLSMSELLNRMVGDHLPGGSFYNATEEVIASTKSAMKHNKLPEFVFGQLDQLLRYRPNATLLTNESYLMYSHNKTREWLISLDNEERETLVTNARKEGRVIRSQFKVRLREIEAKRLEIQEQRRRKLEETERKRLQELEKRTSDVCYYGLWQSVPQLDEGLQRLDSDNEKRDALKAQLRFRKTVLKQKHRDGKVFNFSRKGPNNKYTALTLDEMKQNVIKLIEDCLQETTERQHQDLPLLVGKHVKHKFSDGNEYKGYVISVVPGFGDWYNIQYENDTAIYAYNLCSDYKQGDLQLLVGN